MRPRLREADCPQPAFIEVNGDLRPQRGSHGVKRICGNPAEPVIRIARANNVPPDSALEPPPSTRQPKPGSDSIPIEHGPAQFNEFYPQCSGSDSYLTPEELSGRSTTDRILDDIVPLTSRLLCDTIRP